MTLSFGGATFLSLSLLWRVYLHVTQSKYGEKTEIKLRQRPTMCSMDRFSSPFTVKNWGFVCTVGQLIN